MGIVKAELKALLFNLAGKTYNLVELWTRAGRIKVNLKKGVDIRKFDRLIANELLK